MKKMVRDSVKKSVNYELKQKKKRLSKKQKLRKLKKLNMLLKDDDEIEEGKSEEKSVNEDGASASQSKTKSSKSETKRPAKTMKTMPKMTAEPKSGERKRRSSMVFDVDRVTDGKRLFHCYELFYRIRFSIKTRL